VAESHRASRTSDEFKFIPSPAGDVNLPALIDRAASRISKGKVLEKRCLFCTIFGDLSRNSADFQRRGIPDSLIHKNRPLRR
jgi:hypothetical protein